MMIAGATIVLNGFGEKIVMSQAKKTNFNMDNFCFDEGSKPVFETDDDVMEFFEHIDKVTSEPFKRLEKANRKSLLLAKERFVL